MWNNRDPWLRGSDTSARLSSSFSSVNKKIKQTYNKYLVVFLCAKI